ncbi:MAG: NHLP bacteriocin export ABC transporter permease/ATPase subunit [Christensenellaceae bacterium]|nr:NHLP bacteriocin export ABC transporter permease/ATPase subunit [Christensenellaceae bacterium]
MGWFDEQIKDRIRNDEDGFAQSFAALSGAIMGRRTAEARMDERTRAASAIGEILKYYRVKPVELPDSLTNLDEQLEFLMRPSGIMRRLVKLTEGFYKDAVGPLLGRTKEGSPVAILPNGLAGYAYYDYGSGRQVRVTRETAGNLDEAAVCFYKPLPLRKIGIRDLLIYIAQTLSASDLILISLAALAATLIGMLSPYVSNLLFGAVIPGGDGSLLIPLAALMIGVTVSTRLIGITRSLILGRVQTKMNIAVQAASMMRVLSLPAAFFKEYSSGEMSSRAQSINSLCGMLANTILSTGLTSLFSLAYIGQIGGYAPGLVAPALAIVLATAAISLVTTLLQTERSERSMRVGAKLSGLVFALFSGVQKIKLAGAERRAFAKWSGVYSQAAEMRYAPPLYLELLALISSAVTMLGTIAIYFYAVTSGVGVAGYMAFNVSYGMVSGAFMSLAGITLTLANIRPTLKMVEPILNAEPEVSEGKRVITRLSGGIEVNNVSFRYAEEMPLVLDNISLKIKPGQYVAIVGATGCGKSTLLRLLLGFEKPQKGAVYYDGKDISTIDLRSLRRHIGVVMQGGKLFQGDIYSNITVSAPWLTQKEAWAAAELAGIADDIRDMPMGMHTMISEGSGGISGGQRQRLMIARAVAPGPKVLMFDEATSALDNITQKKVSQSLDAMKATRIVIAHRLSTIRQCDRVIVLEKGRIVEDGNYDELIAKNGSFAALVARQRLDDTAYVGHTTTY